MKVLRRVESLAHPFDGIIIFLAACLLVIGACSSLSVAPRRPEEPRSPPGDALSRCGRNITKLCVASFGLDETGRMVIRLLAPPATRRDLHVKLEFKGKLTVYPCVAADQSVVDVYCTGAPVPLGSSVSLGVYAADGSDALASGDFVVSSLALPTLSISGTQPVTASPGAALPTP